LLNSFLVNKRLFGGKKALHLPHTTPNPLYIEIHQSIKGKLRVFILLYCQQNIPYTAQRAQAYNLRMVVSICLPSGLRLSFGALGLCALVSHNEDSEQYKLM